MSAGLIPDEGIAAQLEYILRAPILGVLPWEAWLFVNDLEPTIETVLDDLELPTWSGYSAWTLAREQWSTPDVENGCARSVWGTDPLRWTHGGGPSQTPYGYALVDRSSDLIRFIQRFDDDDIAPLDPGATLVMQPVYTLGSHECAGSFGVAFRRRSTRRVR